MSVFILTLIDNVLKTIRSKLEIHDHKFIPTLMASIGFMVFQLSNKIVANNKSDILILYCGLAVFIGTYFSYLGFDKFKKDSVWIYDIISPSNIQGKELADIFHENNIAIATYKGFNSNKEKVLNMRVYSSSKEVSTLIENLIPNGFSYHVVESKKHEFNQ